MNTFEQQCLASIIECEEKQNSSIQHEWILMFKVDAVRLANYLRGFGYAVTVETRYPVGVELFYVGVPFQSIKKTKP